MTVFEPLLFSLAVGLPAGPQEASAAGEIMQLAGRADHERLTQAVEQLA